MSDIKSIILFEFLSSNIKTRALLQAFNNYFEVNDWKTFQKKFLPLMFMSIKSKEEGYINIEVLPGPDFQENCRFLEKIIIDDDSALVDCDFRKIRAKPFFKIDNGTYRVIYDLFVFELLFKGLYFKLNEINQTLPVHERIKNFRSFYADEFSEKYLLYNLLAGIYHKRYIKFTGSEMKAYGIDAEPDYYIRNGNKIFLFESKDIFINAQIKMSSDFKIQEPEFKKKLYYEEKDSKVSNKAVLQLCKNIKRILNNELPFDHPAKSAKLVIYPIILLHDHMYNVPGLNFLINTWYSQELNQMKAEDFPIERLQPVTIIDIDSLIYHQDILREKKVLLEDIIDAYNIYVKPVIKKSYPDFEVAKNQIKSKTISFGTYLSNYVLRQGIRQRPRMIKQKGYTLFDS